jgi:hypothetical protein
MSLIQRCLLAVSICCTTFCGTTVSLVAAEFKPFYIQSLAPADEILADVDYITGVFGAEESGKMARQLVGPYLGGIDRKRPSGLAVALGEGDEMIALGFIPVTSLAAQIAILEEQIGKPEDLGNSVFKFTPPEGAAGEGAPEALFVTERDGWAFIAQSEAHLKDLPKDPLALLNGLHKKYDYGLRFDITGIPAEKRAEGLKLLREQMEMELANPDQEKDDALSKESMETLLTYAEGLKTFEFGMSIDAAARNVNMAIALDAQDGTKLAKALGSAVGLKTNHAGVLVKGAAFITHRAAKFGPEEVEAWNTFMKTSIKEANQEAPAAENELPPEVMAEAKALMERFVLGLHADGSVDYGYSVVIDDDKLTLIGGMHVADLAALEADLQKLFEKAKEHAPDKIEVDWKHATHGGVRIVKVTNLEKEEVAAETREFFGDEQVFFLGIDKDYVYFSVGHEALNKMKEAIDLSQARAGFDVLPFRARIDIAPIAKLSASKIVARPPQLEPLLAKLEAAGVKTGINIQLVGQEQGVQGRFEIEEGVLSIMPELGQMIYDAFMQGFNEGLERSFPEPDAF